jgi:ATP-independent RNA helicase DbpA
MEQPSSGSQFSALPLSPASLANLARLGYDSMTPVQAASLPLGLAGHDLIVQAKTGSGKTAAFGLVLLSKLDLRTTSVQALVLCPTRELAEQVAQELRRLARTEENLKVLTLCGGTPARAQMTSLEYGAHVVVGTPGRLLDLIRRESLKLDALNTLVFDEADRMLDMGFFDDIVALARACPSARQTLLFSATYPEGIAQLSRQFLREPKEVKLLEQHASTKIRQVFHRIEEEQRLDAVTLLLDKHRPVSTLAFCNTREQCRDLLATLEASGYVALALHGELEQIERDQVLIQFANRSCSVLVATDVAARGLDIAQLEAVINVDITPDPSVHTHRIGRTGRVDAEGWAFSLASRREQVFVERIEEAHGVKFEWANLPPRRTGARTPLQPPMATLQILGGRREKLRAGDVLGALTGSAGFSATQVGKIHVNEHAAYVAVERSIAPLALQKLSQGKVKGRSFKVRLLDATQR